MSTISPKAEIKRIVSTTATAAAEATEYYFEDMAVATKEIQADREKYAQVPTTTIRPREYTTFVGGIVIFVQVQTLVKYTALI